MPTTMSRLWNPMVADLAPYVPGEQPKMGDLIKLNTNENPYPPSPRALEAIRRATDGDLRLYPDPGSEALRRAIGAHHGIDPARVFVGNGSDEVLAHVFLALLKHDRPLLFPDISYSFYPVYCGLYGIDHRRVPLDEAFRIRPDDYAGPNGGVILPNPNAPTGRALALDDIARIVRANPDSVVVIDEAYVDFGADSAIPLTAQHDNLLVVQTLSKSRSLAGLRVGFAVGDPQLVEALERVKNSFNSYPIDRLAAAGAAAAYEDVEHFEATRRQVIESREWLAAALGRLGFDVIPSQANFVFCRHPQRDAAALQRALRERRIIVRHFTQPRIDQYLRISIGTQAQCEALVDALGAILSA